MAIKLAADTMLGGLAKWLRFLGQDTLYLRLGPEEPVPDRVLITRRTARPHQRPLSGWLDIIRLSANHTQSQLIETIQTLDLTEDDFRPFTLCGECNILLETVSKEDVVSFVPEYVAGNYREFSKCPGCRRIYWPGTHQARMLNIINNL